MNPIIAAAVRGCLAGVFITVLLLSLDLGLTRSVALWLLFMAWDTARSWEILARREQDRRELVHDARTTHATHDG